MGDNTSFLIQVDKVIPDEDEMTRFLHSITLSLFFVGAAQAGVSNIEESGTSSSGKQAYTITCSDGRERRIWFANGQWYDSLGAQGGNYRDLNEQAEFLCR
jgi:hypothetical protein